MREQSREAECLVSLPLGLYTEYASQTGITTCCFMTLHRLQFDGCSGSAKQHLPQFCQLNHLSHTQRLLLLSLWRFRTGPRGARRGCRCWDLISRRFAAEKVAAAILPSPVAAFPLIRAYAVIPRVLLILQISASHLPMIR